MIESILVIEINQQGAVRTGDIRLDGVQQQVALITNQPRQMTRIVLAIDRICRRARQSKS